MNKQIERVKKIRIFLLDVIKDLTPDQLNEIPAGFNNNIIWNLGHLVAAQQGISYARSGQPVFVPAKYMASYKTGTRPEHFVDAEEVEQIKLLLLLLSTSFNKTWKVVCLSTIIPGPRGMGLNWQA